MEGPEERLIDVDPPPYCSDPSLFEQPMQQATTSGQPMLTLRDGRLCPEGQPAYSAFRDPSFGHGEPSQRAAAAVHGDRSIPTRPFRRPYNLYECAAFHVQLPAISCRPCAGLLVLRNASTAEWSWLRHEQGAAVAADNVVLHRTAGCGQRPAAAGEQQERQGAASGSGSSRGGAVGPGVLALATAAATVAALQDV